MVETVAYKVLTAEEFAGLERGAFLGSAVDRKDGYIHLSTARQLTETVKKHFSGQSGLMVVAVDLARLGEAVRWEVSRGGAKFPHVYGALTMAAVLAWAPLEWGAEGTVRLPEAAR